MFRPVLQDRKEREDRELGRRPRLSFCRQDHFLHKKVFQETLPLELMRFAIRRYKNPQRCYTIAITNRKIQEKKPIIHNSDGTLRYLAVNKDE